jgi:hypothetical protein
MLDAAEAGDWGAGLQRGRAAARGRRLRSSGAGLQSQMARRWRGVADTRRFDGGVGSQSRSRSPSVARQPDAQAVVEQATDAQRVMFVRASGSGVGLRAGGSPSRGENELRRV